MDVLHITHQFAPETRGGVESYLGEIAGEQLRRGADVHVLTGSHAPRPTACIEATAHDGVPVHRLHRDDLFFDLYSKAWNPNAEALIAAFLDRHAPRVVHVHQWIRMAPNLVALAHARGIPTVVTLHDHYSSCPRAFRMRADGAPCFDRLTPEACGSCAPRYGHETDAEVHESLAIFRADMRSELLLADRVLVPAESTGRRIAGAIDVPADRFDVLPHGYRPRFGADAKLPRRRAGERLRVAFWGAVARHKGIEVLVDAVRRLAHLSREFEVHVLGRCAEPELEQRLARASRGLPITFHGEYTFAELRALAPHVGVFPSTCMETHGIVLDECFELGLPCVVSDLGVLADRAGASGLVVRAGDGASLADAIARLITRPDVLARLAANVPSVPAPLAAHVRALTRIYAEVEGGERRAIEGLGAAPTSPARRIAQLLRQRESALATLPPPAADRDGKESARDMPADPARARRRA